MNDAQIDVAMTEILNRMQSELDELRAGVACKKRTIADEEWYIGVDGCLVNSYEHSPIDIPQWSSEIALLPALVRACRLHVNAPITAGRDPIRKILKQLGVE